MLILSVIAISMTKINSYGLDIGVNAYWGASFSNLNIFSEYNEIEQKYLDMRYSPRHLNWQWDMMNFGVGINLAPDKDAFYFLKVDIMYLTKGTNVNGPPWTEIQYNTRGYRHLDDESWKLRYLCPSLTLNVRGDVGKTVSFSAGAGAFYGLLLDGTRKKNNYYEVYEGGVLIENTSDNPDESEEDLTEIPDEVKSPQFYPAPTNILFPDEPGIIYKSDYGITFNIALNYKMSENMGLGFTIRYDLGLKDIATRNFKYDSYYGFYGHEYAKRKEETSEERENNIDDNWYKESAAQIKTQAWVFMLTFNYKLNLM